jgi:ketosteroid isomerase-like protein
MPADALQLSRASVERWNDGDMAGIYDLWADDIVVRPDPEFPEGVCFGRDAAQHFYESYREGMGLGHLAIQEEHNLGSVCLSRINHPVHSRSGIESAFAWSLIVTAREGKMIMIEFFIDHARALVALGLEPA